MGKEFMRPVAWIWQFQDGELYEDVYRAKEECERECCGYDGIAVPLYQNTPVQRDVLMAFGDEVISAIHEYNGVDISAVDITDIADRYASKVQPEPANQQLLAALKMVLDDQESLEGRPRTYECVMEAIAAAEAAQKPEGV